MPDIFDQLDEAPASDIFDEVEDRGTPDVPRGTAPVEQAENPLPKLRSESFKMLNQQGRVSPSVQRNVADRSSGLTGDTLKGGKNLLGRASESVGRAIETVGAAVAGRDYNWQDKSLNEVFDYNDLKEARDKIAPGQFADQLEPGVFDKPVNRLVQYFEGNGITDGKEMMTILKDSIAENNWDATSDDKARVLSDGTLRVNPKFVALPDAQEGIKAIQSAPVDDATRQQETQRFLAARKIAATALDEKARSYDADYRKYADEQAAKGITDPEQVFFSWPGLDRNWIEGSWDVVRDTVSQSGRDLANTGRAAAMGLASAVGAEDTAASLGEGLIESGKKGEFNREIAAARGQEGAITGTGKELGTTVLDMVPMFLGAGAGRLLAGGAEAAASRQLLGKIVSGTSVYGYAGAQGYASLMQTALETADRKAEQEGRELTPQEIDDTVSRSQGAALANGFQTAILSKILGQGVEEAAFKGLAAEAGEMTGRDVLAAFRQKYGADGVRAALTAIKPELKEFAKQAYEAGKVGFKDEALEEGLNQYLEGVLTKAGADPDKTWDEIGQETFKGAWMGGVAGGGLPVAEQTAARRDPALEAARSLVVGAQDNAPAAAQEAAKDIFDNEEGTQAPEAPGAGETAAPAPSEASAAPLAEAAAAGEVLAGAEPAVTDEPGTPAPLESPEAGAPQGPGSPAVAAVDGSPAAAVGAEPAVAPDIIPEPPAPLTDATLPAVEPAPAAEAPEVGNAPPVGATPESETREAVEGVPVQGDPTVYSPENLATTFNLTPEQAAATDALVQSMGLDTTQIRLTKGGKPGSGIQPTVSRASGQGIKGSFEVLPTGEALLRGLTNPDVSTAVHELSHVARKTLFTRGEEGPVAGITDDDIDVVERWAGAEGGNWDVAAEEKFARGFERYLRDGKAPTKALTPVFEKIGNWLKSIYASVKGSPIDVQIPPAIRAVFDRMVARNAAPETSSAPPENLGTPSETAPSEPVSPPAPQTAESPENLTSVKNEATDAELAAHGFDPIAAPASQALDVSWERALARLERNPAAGQALVDELNTKPRATDDVEHGMLLKMLADAKLAYGRTQQDLTDAELSGDVARIEEAHRQNDIARDAVFNIITAAKATGTVWGRTGRFRQLAIDEDYSLVQMEAKYRTEVNQGKSLTKDQATEVKRMQAEIAKAKQDLEDYRAKEAERLAAAVHEATLATLRRTKPQVRKNLGSKIEEAKKRLKALGLINPDAAAEFLAQEALPDEVIADMATVAAGWMVDSKLTPEQFADRLKRMFGDRAAGQAEVIRAKAREIIDATIEETFNATTGDTATRKPKTRQQVVEDIDAAEGLQGSDVFRLARLHINEGVEGFENVMKAVQADLEAVFPGVTLREIHDAYSGYGKTVFPSKEADLVKLREYRTLARLTSQLEDASKGLSPKRTGMQRDKSSERVRTLQKQVRDMMRKMGIKETSDDQRLKSSLDAVKTRLRNEIEELEVAIRDRAPRPEGSKGVDYDAEANALKAQRDTLKEEYQKIFGKNRLTDDERLVLAERAMARRIAAVQKEIATGESAARNPLMGPWSPKLAAMRAQLDALIEQRNELRNPKKDPETKAIEQAEAALEKSIERISGILGSGKLPDPDTDAKPWSPKISELKEEKAKLDEALKELRKRLGPQPKTAEEKAAATAIRALEKSIADLTARITSGDLSPAAKKPDLAGLDSQVRAMRTQRDSLQATLKAMRDAARDREAEAIKKSETALRKSIERLDDILAKGSLPSPSAKPQPWSSTIADLNAEKARLQGEVAELRKKLGPAPKTDEEKTVAALERQIKKVQELIAGGSPKTPTVPNAPVTSPEIEALRAKLGGLNEQRNALRDREKERLERTKKMVRNRVEKLMDRIQRGDYEPAKKLPPVKADEELGKLQRSEITAKRQFNEKLYEAQLARRSRGQKIYDGVIEIFNASRSIITSADLSAVLRQGGFIVFGNPLRALKAIPAMFRAGVSADYAEALSKQIEANPKFVQSQKAGLFLSEFGDTHHFSKMEEQFRGKLAKKIPGIGKVVEFSERTYTAFLNKLRMDTFEAMANSVSPTGDLTEGEAKVIANFINIATGRGNLERFDKSAEVLAAAFFSPKYVVSRFQLLAMPMTGFRAGKGASARTRKAIATEYGKTMTGIGAAYTLVALAKAMLDDEDKDKVTIETDPRSSDFGKVKIGNTRVDFLFGLLQSTVFLSRIYTGEKKRADSKIVAMRGDDAGFGESVSGTLGTFLRTKLAPIPGTMVNLIDGKDVVGNKVFWETELIGNMIPLSMGDIFSTMKEQGIPAGTAIGLLSIFGAGGATYSTDDQDLNLEQEIAVKLGVDPGRYAED